MSQKPLPLCSPMFLCSPIFLCLLIFCALAPHTLAGDMYLNPSAGYIIMNDSTADGNVMTVKSGGNVGIGTTGPSCSLDVNSNKIRVRTAKTPASAANTGGAGDICWDADYVYICVATNTWKRAAISTW